MEVESLGSTLNSKGGNIHFKFSRSTTSMFMEGVLAGLLRFLAGISEKYFNLYRNRPPKPQRTSRRNMHDMTW